MSDALTYASIALELLILWLVLFVPERIYRRLKRAQYRAWKTKLLSTAIR